MTLDEVKALARAVADKHSPAIIRPGLNARNNVIAAIMDFYGQIKAGAPAEEPNESPVEVAPEFPPKKPIEHKKRGRRKKNDTAS